MSTKPRTTVHATTVSKTLAQRFTKSTSAGSRVRGYRTEESGFKVIKPAQFADEGTYCVVEHITGNDVRMADRDGSAAVTAHNTRIERYAAYLREQGYTAIVRAPYLAAGNSLASRMNIIEVRKGEQA